MKRALLCIAILLLVLMITMPAVAREGSASTAPPAAATSPADAATTTLAESGTLTGTATTVTPETTEEPEPVENAPEKSGKQEGAPLALYEAVWWGFLGIFTSFAIPVLKKYAAAIIGAARKREQVDNTTVLWNAVSPYIATTLLAALMAVVVVAVLYSEGTEMTHWYVPFLAGYLFDSTIQKVKPGKDDPPPS